MRIAQGWKDYELLDASDGEKLERWGDIILIRPDPQAIWKTPKTNPMWKNAHARYIRSSKGGGSWDVFKNIPESWNISFEDLTFEVKPMGFKHTGVFPEQSVNWQWLKNRISAKHKPFNVLNLFAYTGGATSACLSAGASVTHVDASKGMVQRAKENARLSQVADKSVRWIVDDCEKFIQREIRRGKKYDAVILDPPSYGRGTNGEVWQLENNIYSFLKLCVDVCSDNFDFIMLNTYSAGLSPATMEYMLSDIFVSKFGGGTSSEEIGLPVTSGGGIFPCGSTAFWTAEK